MIPKNKKELKVWVRSAGLGRYSATASNVELAGAIVMQGWRERASERGMPEPSDLTDACKFAALFAKVLFGGELRGSHAHHFNIVDGVTVDLTVGSEWMRSALAAGVDPYRHDPSFFGNREHIESLQSCLPRVHGWIRLFDQAYALEAQATISFGAATYA